MGVPCIMSFSGDTVTQFIKDIYFYSVDLQSKGSILELRNVTRYDEGTYQCLAYNGVAPAATKDIHIGVLCKY